MSERKLPSHHSRGSTLPGKLLKAVTLVLFTGFGYLLGVRVIGPSYSSRASTLQVSTASLTRHSSAKPAQTASQDSSAADNDPIAVITPGRRNAAAVDPDARTPSKTARPPKDPAEVTPSTSKHHSKVRTADDTAHKPAKETAGDQSVLPQDKANVSGADNEPSGSAHSHRLDTSQGDTGLPGAGDAGGGRDRTGGRARGDHSDARSHHSHEGAGHTGGSSLPGADESVPGDTTPIMPHAGGHAHKGTDRSTALDSGSRHWAAVDHVGGSVPNA